jgi:iron-sulfur cluster assembly accessory protein
MELTVTEGAEKFIRRMLRFGGAPGSGFRVVVTTGGCSGLAGDFTVETAPLPGDAVFEYKDVRFFLPAESRLLLEGVTIDFADTPTQTGLVFVDPKAKAGGCGSSAGKDSLPGEASISISSISRRH